jgi:nicotinamide riboside transporter PnuC
MRLLLGIILGGVLMIGGSLVMVALLEAWGIKREATFADGCLAIIVILLSILLVKGSGRAGGNENTFRKW